MKDLHTFLSETSFEFYSVVLFWWWELDDASVRLVTLVLWYDTHSAKCSVRCGTWVVCLLDYSLFCLFRESEVCV